MFIGRADEFPSLAAHGGTQEKALRQIRHVVEYVLEDLAAESEREGASLNNWINTKLASTVEARS